MCCLHSSRLEIGLHACTVIKNEPSDVKTEIPEVKLEFPAVKLEGPDVKPEFPAVKLERPEVKFEVSQVKLEASNVKSGPSRSTCKPLLVGDDFMELKRRLRQKKDKVSIVLLTFLFVILCSFFH
jgi:hypothetical protein